MTNNLPACYRSLEALRAQVRELEQVYALLDDPRSVLRVTKQGNTYEVETAKTIQPLVTERVTVHKTSDGRWQRNEEQA